MPITSVQYTLQANNRVDIRNELVSLFLKEQPGTGKGDDCSAYRYMVETFNHYSVVLNRPVGLNKGFDFTVNIDGMKFKKKRTYSYPSHQNIVDILQAVKNANPIQYQSVALEIRNIYNCSSPNLQNVAGITFLDYTNTPRPIEIILLAIRWLFVEQDITYWNWSGRNMLFSSLQNLGLV